MTDLNLKAVPARNLLTGAVVTLPEDHDHDVQLIGDAPGNLTLAWKDLSVYRRKRNQTSIWRSATYEEIKVIHEVNGVVSSGNLVALMGASGAGKTSLLAAISRRDKSTMTGYLMLNGRLAGAELIARISGFVPQQDLAVEDLNVMEHMEFMARLMMDRRSTKVLRTKRINQLLLELSINNCAVTRLKDLSGGERKRVALAVQLLNDPPILFCDEPTSGLDSWAASAVVARLRDLATGGKIVVCSVHQPASGVFDLFHQVVLLASGKIAFHGNLEEASNFFASIGYKCPLGFNAAEYYVSLLGIELDKEIESRERIRRICDEYQRSDIATAIEEQIADVPDEMEYFTGDLEDEQNQYLVRYLTLVKVGFFVQFYWLMWRNIQSIKHNKTIYIAEFLLLMFVGLIISVPYMGHFDEMDQRDIQNIEGLLYLTITEDVFLFIYAVFITFPSEVPILLRETANGLYSTGPYYLSKMLFWIPRAVIEPTLFGSMIFLVAGLRGGFTGWLGFCIICVLCANWGNAYGSFLSAVFDKLETAALFSVPFELIGTMFSGLYLNLASVSAPISWLKYISGFYYGVESISILQWNAIETINCVQEPGQPCIRTGHDVLNRFGFDENNFWRNCVCLVVMYFVSHLISFLMVIRRSRGTPVY